MMTTAERRRHAECARREAEKRFKKLTDAGAYKPGLEPADVEPADEEPTGVESD